mgnify:CR=1 FL=1
MSKFERQTLILNTMKKILFPTDFSDAATNAFVHALEFAKVVNAELILLHTFEIPVYDSQFFPENYASIYSSIELAKFEMFKDEIPKLRTIAAERKLDDIVIKVIWQFQFLFDNVDFFYYKLFYQKLPHLPLC